MDSSEKTIGRRKCDVMKDIRKKIAEENGVPFVCHECHETRDCAGTCPLCDYELQQLEMAIEQKKKNKSLLKPAAAIVVTGMMATTMLPSCGGTPGPVPVPLDSCIVDSSMVGQKHIYDYYDESADSVKQVEFTITEKMIGEELEYPDSGSHVWKAIEKAKKK